MTDKVKMSLEEFADVHGRNVSLREFRGRRVVEVFEVSEESRDQYDGAVWWMRFAEGGEIINYDPLVKAPFHLVGTALTMQILGGHKNIQRDPVTELRFGLEPLKLNPLEYAMLDPQVTNDVIVFPQRSRANVR